MTFPALLIGVSSAAHAEEEIASDDAPRKEERFDPTYQSFRVGRVSTDFDNLKEAVSLGGTLGINIPRLEWLSVEIDLGYTIIPGENQGQPSSLGGGSGGSSNCTVAEQLAGLCTPDSGGNGSGSQDTGRYTTSNDDFYLTTAGVFASLRSPGNVFALGRIGYRYIESTIPELNENQTGTAYGVGIGYRYSPKGMVEISFNQYGDDIQLLSLGISY